MNVTKDGRKCQNSTVIDNFLMTNVFQFFIQDINLTPQNYHSPIQIREKVFTAFAYKYLYQQVYSELQMVIVETDEDFIGLNAFSRFN